MWSCAPRFQRPITAYNQNYSMMLGHCFAYSARDGFRASERVVPLADEVCHLCCCKFQFRSVYVSDWTEMLE